MQQLHSLLDNVDIVFLFNQKLTFARFFFIIVLNFLGFYNYIYIEVMVTCQILKGKNTASLLSCNKITLLDSLP